jgi:hypothetical protein
MLTVAACAGARSFLGDHVCLPPALADRAKLRALAFWRCSLRSWRSPAPAAGAESGSAQRLPLARAERVLWRGPRSNRTSPKRVSE